MATHDPVPDTHPTNTVFVLSNGDPDEWMAVPAGQPGSDWAFIARVRNVSDELLAKINNAGVKPHWNELLGSVRPDDIDILR